MNTKPNKKQLILAAINNNGPQTLPDLYDLVGEQTEQTLMQMGSYISYLKNHGFLVGGGDGGKISLTEVGENYLIDADLVDSGDSAGPADDLPEPPADAVEEHIQENNNDKAVTVEDIPNNEVKPEEDRKSLPEILAMDEISRIMDSLRFQDETRRVLAWVSDKYNLDNRSFISDR